MKEETIRCSNCNKEDNKIVQCWTDKIGSGREQSVTLIRCNSCKLEWMIRILNVDDKVLIKIELVGDLG